MKKMSTLLVLALLLVPAIALGAPKKRITMPMLKKQVASLVKENTSLKSEIELLKNQLETSKTELNFCRAYPQVIERKTIEQAPPVVITRTVATQSNSSGTTRYAKFNASGITDGVEINGLETVTGILFQISNLESTDTVVVSTQSGTHETPFELGSRIYKLGLNDTKIDVSINGKTYTVEIIVTDSPNDNKNKHVIVSPATQSMPI